MEILNMPFTLSKTSDKEQIKVKDQSSTKLWSSKFWHQLLIYRFGLEVDDEELMSDDLSAAGVLAPVEEVVSEPTRLLCCDPGILLFDWGC
jgi:hypothetical protein